MKIEGDVKTSIDGFGSWDIHQLIKSQERIADALEGILAFLQGGDAQ